MWETAASKLHASARGGQDDEITGGGHGDPQAALYRANILVHLPHVRRVPMSRYTIGCTGTILDRVAPMMRARARRDRPVSSTR